MREPNTAGPGQAEPPAWARRLLAALLPHRDRLAVLEELDELFAIRAGTRGRGSARRWYWRQVASFAWAALQRPRETEVLGGMRRQIGHSVRGLVAAPAFATTAVVTLALGIGAPVALFSVVHGVLLRAMPYPEPDRLVWIFTDAPPNRWNFSAADYLALEERNTTLASFGAWTPQRVTYNDDDGADRILAYAVTPGFLPTLGVEPALGRTFSTEEGKPGAAPVAIVSHEFWQTRLGGDRGVVGSSIRLNGQPYQVIGILPPDVGPLAGSRVDVWPAMQVEPPTRKGPFFLKVVGRLAPGVTLDAARQELHAINDEIFPVWAGSYADQAATWGALPISEFVVGDVRTALWVLLGASVLVLLIAATNVANLVLSRATARSQELAVRSALGASRLQLIGLQVSETLLLAFVGGAAGVALAHFGVQALAGLAPRSLPRVSEIGLHPAVLGLAFLLIVGTGIVVGLVPGLGSGDGDVGETIRSGRRAGGPVWAGRLRGVLVAAQFAIALPLLVGAGLLTTSFSRLLEVDPGFDPDRVMSFQLSLLPTRYPDLPEINDFWDRLESELQGLPGIDAVGYNDSRPPDQLFNYNNFALEIRRTPEGASDPGSPWLSVDRGYFSALEIPLVAGRFFDEDAENANEIVVDRQWVRQHVPEGVDPLGLRLLGGSCTAQAEPEPPCAWQIVVGIVGDVKYVGLAVDDGAVYYAQRQAGNRDLYVFLGGPGADPAILPQVRDVVRRLDPELAVSTALSGQQFIAGAVARPRYLMTLFGLFAAMALVLASVGIYGVMSYFVSQHVRDIGIRLALGGRRGNVLGMVVGQGLRLALTGAAVGAVAAWGLSRFVASLLYGVAATDPTTFAAVTLALGITAVFACWIPARRATRVDPMVALRID